MPQVRPVSQVPLLIFAEHLLTYLHGEEALAQSLQAASPAVQEAVEVTVGLEVQEHQDKDTQAVINTRWAPASQPDGQEVAVVLEVQDLHIHLAVEVELVQFLHWLLRHMAHLVLQQVDGLQEVVPDITPVL